ncbi:hypothetical protein R3P38DRAFT_3377653 [Favolaschia claudopus]|uniref:Zn(2)-C6 fungal-type domain-containing protein n=1 Tax=Favolaschia claudopus TaxID=2862362 RepID=A0AAV9ZBF3_9AGAR
MQQQRPGRPAGPQLPSIRTLHPYLPPPAAMESTAFPTPTLSTPTMPMPMMTFSAHPGYPPSSYADSDADERDPSGDAEPPKKKRRRQALSCTECKRRKIRCDRTQPCAPCVRRGDQAKCQWNVVEPATEKYVPRAEYDALHRRVDMLEDALRSRIHAFEDYVYRLPPHVLASHPLPPHLLPATAYPPPFIAPPQPFDPRHSPHSPYAPQAFTAPIPQSFAPGGTQSFVASPSTSSFAGPSSSSGGIPPSLHLHQPTHSPHLQQQHPHSSSFSPNVTHARRPSFSPTTSTSAAAPTISPVLHHRSSGSLPQYTQQQQQQIHGAPPPGSGSLPPTFTHPSSSSEIHARSVSGSASPIQTRARRTGSVSSHPEVSSSAGHQPFPVGQGSWGTGGDAFPPHSSSSSSPSIPVTTTYSSHGNAGGGSASGGGIGSQGQGPSQGQVQGQGGMGMGTYSASTSSSSLAPSTGRTSAGSLSSFTSSASSATPTTLSIPSSLPPPYSSGFHGGGGRGGGGGGGGAVTATRLVRSELSVSIDLMKNNSKRKREIEDAHEGGRGESPDPSKNPYAQALQGARLRSRHRAPWLPLPALHPVIVRVPLRAHPHPQRRATGEIEARSGSPHRGGGDALTSASSSTVAVTLPPIHTISVAESSSASTSADPSSASSHRMSGGRGGLDAGQSREPQPGFRYRSTSASEGSAWAWRGTPPTTRGRG